MNLNIIKNKYMRRILMTIPVVTLLFVVFGQGCSGPMDPLGGGGGSSVSTGYCRTDGANVVDKNYPVLPGESTVSILYGSQILDSFVSCTGIVNPSQNTLDTWRSRSQSLSEYGSLTDISGAMMMSIAAVSAEVCQDLVTKESATTIVNNRIFFGAVNLSGTRLIASEIQSAARLLALSCWQRPMTVVEETLVTESILQINTNSANGALSLCTAMLSSLAAIQQ